MKFLFLVLSNLKRRKLRTVLTILSIFIAFLLFGILCSMKAAFLGGVEVAGADRLVVRHKISLIQPLPESYEARMANVEGVDAVTALGWFGGIYKDPKNQLVTIVVQPEKYLEMFPEVILPEDQKLDWLATRNGAIVGKDLLKRFGWKLGDIIPLTSPIWGQPANQPAWEFKIVGVYDSDKKNFNKSQFFFRYDFFDEGKQKAKGQVGWFAVRVKDADRSAEVAAAIDLEFANSPAETKAEAEGAFATGFANQIGDIATIVLGVTAAVFFTILLVAGNTMSQSVRERFEELGVLKAMGFTNRLTLALVLIESCVIAIIGGGVGMALAWFIATHANPVPQMLPSLAMPSRDLIVGGILVLSLGILAGLIPAVQAMRLQIAVALRRN
jgi:putative ABC transport system permease protein